MAAFNPFHTAKVLDGLWKRSTGIRRDRGLIQGISNVPGKNLRFFFVVPIIPSSFTAKNTAKIAFRTFLPQLCVAFMIIYDYDYDVSFSSNKQPTVDIAMLG